MLLKQPRCCVLGNSAMPTGIIQFVLLTLRGYNRLASMARGKLLVVLQV